MKFYIIVPTIVIFLFILTTNVGLNAQDNLEKGDPTLHRKFLSLSTNKRQYLPGETVFIRGSIFNISGPVDLPVSLQVTDINYTTDKFIYGAFVQTINGTFSVSDFSAPQKIGPYMVSAFSGYGTSSNVVFEVVNPLFTIQFLMLLFAFGCFAGLIIVILESGKINFAKSEILRFVFISGIVISPIIGLLFSDSELGINSPISLITKPDNSKTPTNSDAIWKNQWFIAVGGLKLDNYMSGILIPFYVIIFGLAGGYLRYLYSASIKIWHLDTSSDAVTTNIKVPLFILNKIPDNQVELSNFKSFLKKP